ncbi:RNA 2'-O ribose methyltransferase substrate binding family protein [Candidatus Phytoplasma oryzae]|uniref:23S rRNA methyltransferase n=1 Tax=Candidatus Phytoplasma oryzae TaxID=203274 RepID=A0A139JQ86_9MOLU|nr:23S rRNA (guanosine(2251)-2'-O)-methyltransferase RlmB [Candidatus Phytoplasma oryzae]KXT29046.1 RNA 2'-O ribose methyltransferase substrate binding family protein [Candidatus Phytoplasma oryzae]RAM57806.1 23S rRNA methyltransferase [Candidatus Phytoplasma oryzae]
MIIYGKNVIKEAIKAKRNIYNLYIDLKFKDFHFLNFVKNFNINYQLLNKHQLNEKAKNNNHQGIVAEVEDYIYKKLNCFFNNNDLSLKKILILDSIQDPHNLGAILRTVEAANFNGVILGKKHQVFLNGTVAKSSSGALEYVDIFLVDNLLNTIIKLKQNGFLIIGTDIKSQNNFSQIPKQKSLAIILGNEGKGIRLVLKQKCDLLIKIPMKGKINSLNVSVAAALMMYFAI